MRLSHDFCVTAFMLGIYGNLSGEEYEKFLGQAGDELEKLMSENKDVLKRLKESE